jgi:hypothetical protein
MGGVFLAWTCVSPAKTTSCVVADDRGPVGLDIQLLHQPLILRKIAAYELRECRRAAADRLLRRLREAVADSRIAQRLVNLGIEARDDGRRGPSGHEHAEPLVEHELLESCFPVRRHVRQTGRALCRRLRQQPQRARLVMRNQRRRSERPHHDVAGDKVVDGLPAAAIRHVVQRDAGELRKPRRGDMLL